MNPPGRHRRKDAQMEAKRNRAERAAWRIHPYADRIFANPAHNSEGCLVEVWHEGHATLYRFSGPSYD